MPACGWDAGPRAQRSNLYASSPVFHLYFQVHGRRSLQPPIAITGAYGACENWVAAARAGVHAAAKDERRGAVGTLPDDGLVAVVKRDCPTCVMTAPVLGELARRAGITVFSQDDPSFPDTVPAPVDDLDLGISHRLKIEVVPTLIRLEGGREIARTYGWDRG